ncbi:unnamed protein product [Toxocara canis]|uniref:WD_REPEATS_REGION domain-containing protein n=1 Tax=Toxocara canis TaxID=6265 RepID=A0A183UZJ4_TOXCA|nr:unnamed protein product [Toxocara canis]
MSIVSLQYTCLDASPHYLAVGSSSGTVYLFSRYASKYRSRLSSIPVQVVSTKDGPVIKMAISPDEKYLASAGLRGPLTVSALSTVGHSPTTIVSNTCHVGNGLCSQDIVDASQANHVTELRWSDDSRKVYAGDLKGQVSCTRIQSRNLFRSPCDVLLETDSAIVQIDVRDESLLVSTLTRCCLCDLATLDCIQVGKKLRHGRFGAMFYPTYRHRVSRDEERRSDVVTPRAQADSSISPPLIFASRPNGRLWEANGQGIVYSTHQYRSLSNIARFPVVSFKEDFSPCNISCAACGKHLAFGRLHLIDCQQYVFFFGLLFIRRLEALQAAQVICAMAPQIERSGVVPWRREESTNTKNILQKMLLLSERQRSCSGSPSQTLSRHPVAVVHRLNTGIHRVVRIMDNSGYEDDFTFRAPSPLRQRSKSTPNMEGSVKTMAWKRRSLPLKQNTHQESVFEEKADGEEGSEQVRQRLIQEAFHLLDAESSDEKCLVSSGSADSLRTLLACGEQRVTFHSQVTLGDVPRDLVAAKKLLRLIADKERRNGLEECASGEGRSLENVDHLSATSTGPDFTSLFGRRDPLEGLARCPPSSVWSKEPVSVERLRVVKRPKKGARIVKAIKPLGRPTCGTLDFTFSVSERVQQRAIGRGGKFCFFSDKVHDAFILIFTNNIAGGR